MITPNNVTQKFSLVFISLNVSRTRYLPKGMNLQICFMNETPSDTESSCSESDALPGSTPMSRGSKQQAKQQAKQQTPARPQVLSLPPLRLDSGTNSAPVDEADFFARQARLQTEARMALAQAKEMAHMQMEVERQRLKQSPITEMVRSSLEKVSRTKIERLFFFFPIANLNLELSRYRFSNGLFVKRLAFNWGRIGDGCPEFYSRNSMSHSFK